MRIYSFPNHSRSVFFTLIPASLLSQGLFYLFSSFPFRCAKRSASRKRSATRKRRENIKRKPWEGMLRLLHRFAFSFILVSIFGWAFFLFLFPSFSLAQALKGKGKFGKRKEIALAKGKMETIMTGMRFQVLTFHNFSIFLLPYARPSFSIS